MCLILGCIIGGWDYKHDPFSNRVCGFLLPLAIEIWPRRGIRTALSTSTCAHRRSSVREPCELPSACQFTVVDGDSFSGEGNPKNGKAWTNYINHGDIDRTKKGNQYIKKHIVTRDDGLFSVKTTWGPLCDKCLLLDSWGTVTLGFIDIFVYSWMGFSIDNTHWDLGNPKLSSSSLICHDYLVGGLEHEFHFSISYMGCHPSHWRTPSFFKMVTAPRTSK